MASDPKQEQPCGRPLCPACNTGLDGLPVRSGEARQPEVIGRYMPPGFAVVQQSALDALATAAKFFPGFVRAYEDEWRDGEWGWETKALNQLTAAISSLLSTRETSHA